MPENTPGKHLQPAHVGCNSERAHSYDSDANLTTHTLEDEDSLPDVALIVWTVLALCGEVGTTSTRTMCLVSGARRVFRRLRSLYIQIDLFPAVARIHSSSNTRDLTSPSASRVIISSPGLASWLRCKMSPLLFRVIEYPRSRVCCGPSSAIDRCNDSNRCLTRSSSYRATFSSLVCTAATSVLRRATTCPGR
jgi:hypothetical protein